MDIYKYSLVDREVANYILKNQGKDRFGNDLYKSSFITWANKVIKWFNRFYQVLRHYAKIMKDATLAVKAIWQNINKGISLPRMLRLLANPVNFAGKDLPKYRKCSLLIGFIQWINPKSMKVTRRTRNQHITNALQTTSL